MERRTPNKRKALANFNTTPNKIQKSNTPVSRNNQVQNNGNKFKFIENQKTTLKKQINSKQVEENEEIVSENSMDEADNDEKLEIDESDLDDKLEINEDNSDEEVESGEEAQIEEDEDDDSDEEAQIDEDEDEEAQIDEDEDDDSDEEAQVDDEDADSDKNKVAENDDADASETKNVDNVKDKREFSVFVSGVTNDIPMDRIFPGCKIQSVKKLIVNKKRSPNNALVMFKDQESLKKALAIRKVNIDGKIINVEANKKNMEFTCFVRGIYHDKDLQDLFTDCKILSFKIMEYKDRPTGVVHVYFEDEESMTKALLKNETKYKGRKITVNAVNSVNSYSAVVYGIKQISDVNDIFQDCNLKSAQLMQNNNRYNSLGSAIINFNDVKSLQNALLKSGTKYNNETINLRPTKETDDKERKFAVLIRNLSSDAKIEDIFKDCNILFYHPRTDPETNQLDGRATIYFRDEESVQKALMQNRTEHNGSEITVYRRDCCVFVRGIKEDTKIEKIFTGCKVHSIQLKMNKNNALAGAAVYFKDLESFKKAHLINMPPGIRVEQMYSMNAPQFGHKSNVFKSKFDKKQNTLGKQLLLKELNSQIQKLTKEIYGPESKPFYQKNTFDKRRPRK